MKNRFSILWNHINKIHWFYITNIIYARIIFIHEIFPSPQFILKCFATSACEPLPPLKPGSPVAFYLECRLQRKTGILHFKVLHSKLTFSIRDPDQSSPVSGKSLTVYGSIVNEFPKYFGPEWRTGFNFRDCQSRQRTRQADITRKHSSGDYFCSLPFSACLSGSFFSQKRLFQSRNVFSPLRH